MGLPRPAFGYPKPSSPGDVGSAGHSGAFADAEHVHDRSSETAGGVSADDSPLGKKDTLTLTGTTATWTLSYEPLTDTLHIYNGASVLVEGADYTLSGRVVTVSGGGISGDTLVARYLYVSSIQTTFEELVASLGPLAWYRLGDYASGGVMTDSSGNGHHGTYSSAGSESVAASLISGDSDGAFHMTGAAGEGATVPYGSWMNLATNVSWIMVIKTTDTSARLWAREQATYAWSIQFDGKVYFLASGALVSTSATGGLNDGVKHVIGITYDGSNVRTYFDGVLNKTQAYSTALPTPTTSSDIFTLGYGGGITSSHMYTGDKDEYIMFSGVLTDADMANIAAAVG